MKKTSKILIKLSGIYYLFISLALFLISLFSLFIDSKYVFAIFDMLGFSNISISIIKPISFVMLFLLFIIISHITRKIFASNDNKNYLFNIFTGFFFIFLAVIGHLFIKDNIFILAYIFNILLIIGSMIGLKQKSNNYYENQDLNDDKSLDKNVTSKFKNVDNERKEKLETEEKKDLKENL